MRIREKLLSQPTRYRAELYEDPEAGHMVFVELGFMSALKVRDLGDTERLVMMLMQCVREPVMGEDGQPLIGEDGQPLVGKPVFDRADEEYLRTTDHPVDGWFVRLTGAVGAFLGRSAEEVASGKPATTG